MDAVCHKYIHVYHHKFKKIVFIEPTPVLMLKRSLFNPYTTTTSGSNTKNEIPTVAVSYSYMYMYMYVANTACMWVFCYE
jgi:hypothetical protein